MGRILTPTRVNQKGFLLNPFRFNSAPPSGGPPVYDNTAAILIPVSPSAPLETDSWTIGSNSNRYILAFTGSWDVSNTLASATSVNHSGSGGSAFTPLLADVIPAEHFYTSGRVFGLANPGAGAGTTYAQWTANQIIEVLHVLSYDNVSGVGAVDSTHVGLDGTATGTISLSMATPNTTDLVVGFGWVNGGAGTRTGVAGTGMVDRGGAFPSGVDFYSVRAVEQLRTGSTTTVSMDVTGSGGSRCEMGIIAIVLEGT